MVLAEWICSKEILTSGMMRLRIRIKTVSPIETKENDVSLPTKIPNRSANNPKQNAPTPNVILAVVKIELKSSSLSLQFNSSPFQAPKIRTFWLSVTDGPWIRQFGEPWTFDFAIINEKIILFEINSHWSPCCPQSIDKAVFKNILSNTNDIYFFRIL